MPVASTYLMFSGQCEEAIAAYCALFEDGAVTAIDRYGPGEGGPEGTVKLAAFTFAGARFMAIDNPAPSGATAFTPAVSIFIDCDAEDEVRRLAAALVEGGAFLMPLQSYPFADLFAWVQDRFGVSWQFRYQKEI